MLYQSVKAEVQSSGKIVPHSLKVHQRYKMNGVRSNFVGLKSNSQIGQLQ
jgi:hypothetical protein